MAQNVVLKAKGLHTFPNTLSEIPEGALLEASNVVIDRDSVVNPRRGFKLYGNALSGPSTNRLKQLLTYKNRVLRHYSTRLEVDSDGAGTFTVFNDETASPASLTEVETGLRIKSVEANGNLYITTSDGIKKISALSQATLPSSIITESGVPAALDTSVELNSATGFFSQDSAVAYRAIWGRRDNNNNLLFGAPSERTVITNSLLTLLVNDFNSLLVKLDAAAAINTGTLNMTDYEADLKLASSASSTAVHTALKDLCQKLDADMTVTTYYNGGGPPSIYNDYATAPDNPATTGQLEDLQAFFDAIVDALISESLANIDLNAQTAANFTNSTQSATVDVTLTIPDGITIDDFFQVYRTEVARSGTSSFLSDVDPGDEMALVYEANPTAPEIAARVVTFLDITPDSFREANLYTNANTGEGIAQANERPPIAKDISLFKNSVFYANTKTKHKKQLALLSATDLTNRTLTIGLVGGSSYTYTFKDTAKTTEITCIAGSLFVSGGAADYFDLYTANDEKIYRFWFDVNNTCTPPSGAGVTLVEVDIASTDTAAQVATKLANVINLYDEFSISTLSAVVTVVNNTQGTSSAPVDNVANVGFTLVVPSGKDGSGENVGSRYVGIGNDPTPAQAVDATARSLVRIINRQTTENVNARYISGPNDVPGLILFETRVLTSNAIYFTVSDTTIGDKFNPVLPTTGTSVVSDNEITPNRIYFSKYQEPEAVPLVNTLDIGPKDKKIIRIAALRDSLFVLKEEGVYRVSGDAGQFAVIPFDNTVVCRVPDSVAVINNQIFFFADQGIATLTDTGASIVSRSIEDQLLPLINSEYEDFPTASFGVGYETDRAYLFWTVTDTSDDVATQCFRYNYFTQTWTKWLLSKTCATLTDRLYLGAADTNYVEIERKSYTRLDYADREVSLTMPASAITGTTLTLGALFGVVMGDVLVQDQKLTIAQYNRLLKKLDTDVGVGFTDYYSSLGAIPGDNLGNKLVLLAAKLNADPGVTASDYTATATTNFTTNQTEFNVIVGKLNVDTNLFYNNYPTSTGTVSYEVTVTATNAITKKITIRNQVPFIQGALIDFKSIPTTVVWAPQTFGDPSTLKQVREATTLFEYRNFIAAEAAFSTDLSPGFQTIPVYGEGGGTWGGEVFGDFVWGGDGTSTPFRTYIPREKIRCRFMNCRFKHSAAFEKYALYGLSLTVENTSTRAYK
jgi:hypothetical protein